MKKTYDFVMGIVIKAIAVALFTVLLVVLGTKLLIEVLREFFTRNERI